MKQQTYSDFVRLAGRAIAKTHLFVIRTTRGRCGRRWRGGEVVLLQTQGRNSGLLRTTPLVCIRDGGDVFVVASNGGSDRPPDWWLNLKARPRAEIEVGGRTQAVTVEEMIGHEHDRLAERFARKYPCFAKYRSRTLRQIPVVALRTA